MMRKADKQFLYFKINFYQIRESQRSKQYLKTYMKLEI